MLVQDLDGEVESWSRNVSFLDFHLDEPSVIYFQKITFFFFLKMISLRDYG
jgi:hypothetical protein